MNFDRIFVVNLGRRADRWREFETRANDAGLLDYERFEAIDGLVCPQPKWFRQSSGAWGALCSHYQLAQRAAMLRLENYLVFEDDVVFRPRFQEKLDALLTAVEGTDWDMLYLGGSHLAPPEPYRRGVVRGKNINRLHAYAVAGKFVPAMLRGIMNFPSYQPQWHVDHAIGELHPDHLVLAAEHWLCGQGASKSDTVGHLIKEAYWDLVPPPRITIQSGL